MHPEQTLTILRRTPAVLQTLLADLPDELITRNEGGESWNPADIVGHLIYGEETDWIPRAQIIMSHGETRPFDPFDRFAQFGRFEGWPMERLLSEFARRRSESLMSLAEMKLTEADLERKGTHPELGTVTLGQLLASWVVHDLTHLRQIARVMAKHYAKAVGPWQAYLSILSE